MTHCFTTCKSSDLNDKNISTVGRQVMFCNTLRLSQDNSDDIFTRRTKEALRRMDCNKSKGIPSKKFLEELEQW